MTIVDTMFWAPIALLMTLVWNIWGLVAVVFILGATMLAIVVIVHGLFTRFLFPGTAAYFELKRWQFDKFLSVKGQQVEAWRRQSTDLIQNRVKEIREYPKR